MIEAPPLLFSTETYGYLAERMLESGKFERGTIEQKRFPDGERYYRIETDVNDRDVVLVGGTVSDADTLEVYDLGCAFAKHGAWTLTIVVPYFGYSTMERAVKKGEVVTAKTRARLLSAIPYAKAGNRVFVIDVHSEGIQHYFENAIVAKHIYAKEIVDHAARQLFKGSFVLASVDAGRAKWVQSLAIDMNVNASFVLKRRIDGGKTELTAVSAHVDGQDVVIYDDMIRTGGSLKTAAKAYKEAGANRISVVATHGVFPPGALESLQQCGLFERIITTDTHPRANSLAGDFLSVVSVADLINKNLHNSLTGD